MSIARESSSIRVFSNPGLSLKAWRLCALDEIATLSHPFYDNHLRGGERHMEVGKLIQNVKASKAHMVLSAKPFACMPSSGVSDGVQSLVTENYPQAIFCPIETTGDGAANAYSRVMRDLFQARRVAREEYDARRAGRRADRVQPK